MGKNNVAVKCVQADNETDSNSVLNNDEDVIKINDNKNRDTAKNSDDSAKGGKSGSRKRIHGLDGIRALAVILVVGYHFIPQVFPQGYVGVDVFLVLSGFLITYLLIQEVDSTKRINLISFWARRLRRIVPAVFVMVGVSVSTALFIGGDVLVGIRRQIITAFTFTYNWGEIIAGSTYFDQANPALFKNLWSLAVEEQFYLLWPILLWLLIAPKLIKKRNVALVVALVLAGLSFTWAIALTAHGADATRIHVGTDSHAYGLMLGAALAIAHKKIISVRMNNRRYTALFFGIAGWLGIISLVCLSCAPLSRIPLGTLLPMPAISFIASILTILSISSTFAYSQWLNLTNDTHAIIQLRGAISERSLVGFLQLVPLRWVGLRSYGIYLWHWPLSVLALYCVPGLNVWVRAVIIVALTFICAGLSWKFVEQPIIRDTAYGWMHSLSKRSRVVVIAALAVATTLSGCAIVMQPEMTSAQRTILEARKANAAMKDSLGKSQKSSRLDSKSDSSPKSKKNSTRNTQKKSADSTKEKRLDSKKRQSTSNSKKDAVKSGKTAQKMHNQPEIIGANITVIGDSVTEASSMMLNQDFPGIYVDGVVNRTGANAAQFLADADNNPSVGRRHYVVVGLAANATWRQEWLDALLNQVGSDRKLILVNGFGPSTSSWIFQSNDVIAAYAGAHRGQVFVADWAGQIKDHTDLLAQDYVHPTFDGGAHYFSLAVKNALEEAYRS
ncbi:acyltransferase family protein [Alloscardovia theropitheci]|uniref:acyltransferase family protein n=1 Tax=Alloscardovia theropitheci TaxID=2496842 RepID=UPI0013F15ACA|nr:acyltransferase family protein [Alloscardovia theropitheci]